MNAPNPPTPPDGTPPGGGAPPPGGAGAAGSSPPPRPPRPPKAAKPPRKKHRVQRVLLSLAGIFAIVFLMLWVAYARIQIPKPNDSALRQTTRVLYADAKEPEIGRFGDTNRSIVTLDKIPITLRDAVLAAENRSFYTDNGVSPKGMARALWVNLRGGSTQGGSTITQQYVKNYYLTQERTIKRKFREALLSIKIDKVRSKDQILEDYLNTIYLGRGAYGMQAAAKAYFDKDVSKLSVSESFVLAGIIQSPARYDPAETEGLAGLRNRWNYVANAMVQTGKLTADQRAALKFPKFPENAKTQSRYGGQKGYILNAIKAELLARGVPKEEIENGGLRIVSTLDRKAQESAVAAVTKEFPKTANKGLRVGLAAVQPKTGMVLAMYGGKDFLGKDKYAQVNTATVPIQPGSTMKVFALAALLKDGIPLDATFSGKSPIKVPGGSVQNEFNQSYGKKVTLLKGLEQSINTVFVDATLTIGPADIKKAMVAAGIPEDSAGLNLNALIALGTASIRPIEVVDAYATLCGEGYRAPQYMVQEVFRANGGEYPIDKIEVPTKPAFDAPVVSDVIKAMRNVVQNGTGTRARALGRPAAGKTGTHQDLTAWFTGCTPQLAASVVYFKGDGTQSLDGSGGMSTFFGGTYPTQTWTTFMAGALKGEPVEQFTSVKGVESTATPTPTDEPAPLPPPVATTRPTSGPVFPTFPPFPRPTFTFPPRPTSTPPPSPAPTDPTLTAPPNCSSDPNDDNFSPYCPPGGNGTQNAAGGAPAPAPTGGADTPRGRGRGPTP
jgi:membrane peptidoglycan carboxypeptidase